MNSSQPLNFDVRVRRNGTVEYEIITNNPDGPIRLFSCKGDKGQTLYRLMHGRGKGSGEVHFTERDLGLLIGALPHIVRIEGESEQ